MTTKSSIKRLLAKKKLTGEEVGRLMILDLVEAYKKRLSGEVTSEGLLSDAEKTAMVNGVSGSHDIRVYNAYRDIHNFMINTQPFILMYSMQAELYFWRLFSTALEICHAEQAESSRQFEPTIMTQKQYDELKKADFDEKMTWEYSPEDVLIDALEYYVEKYNAGEETPFNSHFEASKEKPLTNIRIKSNYYSDGGHYVLPDGRTSDDMDDEQWRAELAKFEPYKRLKAYMPWGGLKEDHTPDELVHDLMLVQKEDREGASPIRWVEDNTAPDDATRFDVLECIAAYYYSQETDSKKTIFEFAEDYPELYAAMIDHLASLPGLSSFKAIKKKDFFNESFKLKDLYANKIMGYPDFVDTFNPDGCLGGVAVLQPHALYPNSRIDERGYYVEKPSRWGKHLAESVLANKDNKIEEWRHTVKDALAECFARERAFDVVGDFIRVPDVKIFYASYDGIRDKIDALNGIFALLDTATDDATHADNRMSQKTRDKILKLFEPINLQDLEPTEEAIEAARRSISYETFQGGSDQFIESLKRAVE